MSNKPLNLGSMNRHMRRKLAAETDVKVLGAKAGYKNEHPLIEEKVIPKSLIALRTELAKPEHRDIFLKASKGLTFAECIGTIAAELGILLDGEYDVDDLAEMLTRKLRSRNNSILDSSGNLTPVTVRDSGDTIEILPQLDKFTAMMREAGCIQCDNKAACMAAGRCLGDDSSMHNLTKDQLREIGKA